MLDDRRLATAQKNSHVSKISLHNGDFPSPIINEGREYNWPT